MRVPKHADRDFTASCYVVDDGKILLMNHSKLGFWVQPGGHIDGDETPDEAALRETVEETGWKVEIMDDFLPETDFDDSSEDLPRPFNINLHQISDDHWHCGFQFLAEPVERTDVSHDHENDGIKWASLEELEELEMPENARKSCKTAIKLSRDDGRSQN